MSQRQAGYTIRKFHDPLDDLLDRPIAFNPAFKKITGSTVAAVMLSQSWYWSKRTTDEDGWFYKIGIEWEEETGLTRSEQETARKILKNTGIQEEELRGVPARLYYRVNKTKIYELLGVQFAGFQQTGLPEDNNQDVVIPANINRNTEITTEITSIGADAPDNIPLDWKIANDQNITQRDLDMQFELQVRDAANLIATGMGSLGNDAYSLAYAFMMSRKIIIPNEKIKGQRKAAKEMIEMHVSPPNVVQAVKNLTAKKMTVIDLFSIAKTAIDLANPAPNQEEPTERNPLGI